MGGLAFCRGHQPNSYTNLGTFARHLQGQRLRAARIVATIYTQIQECVKGPQHEHIEPN